MPEFDCPRPITVNVRLGAGLLEIVAEERDTAVVDVSALDRGGHSREAAEHARVELTGDTLIVEPPESGLGWLRRGPALRVEMRVPLDCTVQVKVASAEVRCRGRYAAVSAGSASGDLTIENITGDAAVTTASGRVALDGIGGRLSFTGASGSVTANRVGGEVSGHTASGDVTIGDAAGSAKISTASGEIRIGRFHRGTVALKSASGPLHVGVAQGTAVWLDLQTSSGRTSSDLAMSDSAPSGTEPALNLRLRSASGDIEVRRATATAAGQAA